MNFCFPKNVLQKAVLMSSLLLNNAFANAQTTLISPTGNGGFELGNTFAANGWSVANDAIDGWALGNAPTGASGARAAYISPNGGTTWAYSQHSQYVHLYKTIIVPVGQSSVKLSFKWKSNGDGSAANDLDNLKVFFTQTQYTPYAGISVNNSHQISGAGATNGMYKLNADNYNIENISIYAAPGAHTLIFSWKTDATLLNQPPAAIDDISLVASAGQTVTSTATGGFWSNPKTWVGGVVPIGDDAVIAAGATVVVDNPITTRNLTIEGTLQWGASTNPLTIIQDVLVQNTGVFNPFTTSRTGQTLNIGGHFTNNGTVNAATANTTFHFNGSQQKSRLMQNLDGTGTFIGNANGGILRNVSVSTSGSVTVSTTQNLIISESLRQTLGTLNTNGKLSLNNTAMVTGTLANQSVSQITLTNMGSGYSSTPTVTIEPPTGAGTPATAVANFDPVSGTIRSITMTNVGAGYRVTPLVTITGGGATNLATAIANMPYSNPPNGAVTGLPTGGTTLTGGLTIVDGQSVGSMSISNTATSNIGYTVAPTIGFTLPSGFQNLVTNAGSGYTSAPTVTLTGAPALSGTAPTFVVTVAQGQVVSVVCTSAGQTFWMDLPTLTLTGGGGTGATAVFPTGCLPAATAVLSNEMISDFVITNPGAGYATAPSAAFIGGTAAAVANPPVCRIGTYNLTLTGYSLQPIYMEDAFIPTHRRIQVLTMNSVNGAQINNNLELYGVTPLILTAGALHIGANGANTLTCSNPNYGGMQGSMTSYVNGSIRLFSFGGQATRYFPFEATFGVGTGAGSGATGSTVTHLTASKTNLPSGSVSPSGSITGVRGYRLVPNSGALYGANMAVALSFNPNDGIAADNATLFIGHAAANTGTWTTRSTAGLAGALPTTGSRTGGGFVPTGDDYFAWITTYDFNGTIASGDWSAPTTWSKGRAPICTEAAYIQPNHTVTVNSVSSSKSLIINPLGTLSVVTGANLTVGCTANNNPFQLKGTLNVQDGTLTVNGNIDAMAASTFTQSGGAIHVDGNNGGAIATSVATGTPLIKLSPISANSVNWTGGTLTIVDPHAASTATEVLTLSSNFSGTLNVTEGHTIRYGDGISNTAGGHGIGFSVMSSWNFSTFLPFGNVIVEPTTGLNRVVTASSYTFLLGNLTIHNGGEYINGQPLYLGGDLTVNAGGKLTANNEIHLVNASNWSFTPVTRAQNITNLGLIRNISNSSTHFAQLTVTNSHPNGVTLNQPISVNQLSLRRGIINTTSTNLLTIGSTTSEGFISGGSDTAYVNGPVGRNFYTRSTEQFMLFPTGKNGKYLPVNLAPLTNSTGLVLMAEAFTTNTGTFNAPLVTLATNRWEVTKRLNSTFLTGIGVQIPDSSITGPKEFVQSTSATGVYEPISRASTYTRGWLTTAAPIAGNDFTGFLSYGERCLTPNPIVTAQQMLCGVKTIADLAATPSAGGTMKWYGTMIGGVPFASTDILTNTIYYGAQTIAGGCESRRFPTTTTVNPLPTATITASGVTTFCQGGDVTLTANAGTRLTYQWLKNATAIGNATNRTYGTLQAGAFAAVVTDSNGCKNTSSVINVVVNSNPNVSFTNSLQAGSGSIIDFANTSSTGTAQWFFGDSLNSTSTQLNPSFWYKKNGSYSVKLVVTNANGCSDSTSVMITVTGVQTDVSDLVEPLKINVFPNPVTDLMTVKIENTTVYFGNNDRLIVTNGLGQTVHQAVLNQKITELDTQNWSEGIYNLTIYSNGQMIPVKKVVKVNR